MNGRVSASLIDSLYTRHKLIYYKPKATNHTLFLSNRKIKLKQEMIMEI